MASRLSFIFAVTTGFVGLPIRNFDCNTKRVNHAVLAGNVTRFRIAGILIAFGLLPAAVGQNVPGVPYFQRVNREILRGGQPTSDGFRALSKLGIKTVLDLRSSARQSAWEDKVVKSLGMRYVHLQFHAEAIPTQEQIEKALSVVEDRTQTPVFVHCHEGKDRTGMIIACYRISHDNWSSKKALEEAKSWASRQLTSSMERSIIQYRPRSQPTQQ